MASWKKDSSGNWKKSTSKSDKNYTIVDGKKVLKSSIKSSDSGGVSSSWAKDTVTLEEAKQQSTEAADYLYQGQQSANASAGIVETVDVGSVGIADSWNKDTVTLAEAKAQSGQSVEYLVAKDTQTAEAQAIAEAQAHEEVSKAEAMRNGLVGTNTSMYADITGQYVPSIVNPSKVNEYLEAKEAAKVQAQKRAIEQSQTAQLISGFGRVNLQEDAVQTRSERLADFITGIGSSVKSSSVVQSVSGVANEIADSDLVRKYVSTEDALLAAIGLPTITQATQEASGVVSSISEAASYGFSGGKSGSIEQSDKEYVTAGIARKGQEYAEKVSEKGSALVSKGVDLLAGKDGVIQVPSMLGTNPNIDIGAQTAKDFVTGATVDMGSFLVSGIAGVPLAAEVAVRDPTKFGGALVAGAGLVIGSTAKMAIDDPAKFAGNIAGGLALGKVADVSVKSSGVATEPKPYAKYIRTEKKNIMGVDVEMPKIPTAKDTVMGMKTEKKYVPKIDLAKAAELADAKTNIWNSGQALADLGEINAKVNHVSTPSTVKRPTTYSKRSVNLEEVAKFTEERAVSWMDEQFLADLSDINAKIPDVKKKSTVASVAKKQDPLAVDLEMLAKHVEEQNRIWATENSIADMFDGMQPKPKSVQSKKAPSTPTVKASKQVVDLEAIAKYTEEQNRIWSAGNDFADMFDSMQPKAKYVPSKKTANTVPSSKPSKRVADLEDLARQADERKRTWYAEEEAKFIKEDIADIPALEELGFKLDEAIDEARFRISSAELSTELAKTKKNRVPRKIKTIDDIGKSSKSKGTGKSGSDGIEIDMGNGQIQIQKMKPLELVKEQKQKNIPKIKTRNALHMVESLAMASVASASSMPKMPKQRTTFADKGQFPVSISVQIPQQQDRRKQTVIPGQIPSFTIGDRTTQTQKPIQWVGNLPAQIPQQVPTEVPVIVPGGSFDFSRPGAKIAGFLPSNKKSTRKKTRQSKAKVKPGTLKNKYRNPLDIKFKL